MFQLPMSCRAWCGTRRFCGVAAIALAGWASSCTTPQPDEDQGTGARLNTAEYEAVRRYLPPTAGSALPRVVSLVPYCPTPRHQGTQNACVGWAAAYTARTILYAQATAADPDSLVFSPSFTYNQVHLGDCMAGAYVRDGLQQLVSVGALPLTRYPYNPSSCDRLPTPTEASLAAQFRLQGYTRLSGPGQGVSVRSVKEHLAQGLPVVMAMPVSQPFKTLRSATWRPSPTERKQLEVDRGPDRSSSGLSGHAMVIVGYDDTKLAFQVQNSWGQAWGANGRAWMSYTDFQAWCAEAYGVYPQLGFFDETLPFSVRLLLRQPTGGVLPLEWTKNVTYRLRQPIKPGQKFQIELTTRQPAYVYLMQAEPNGRLSWLFPSDSTQSPYIAVTGERRIPDRGVITQDPYGSQDDILVFLSSFPADSLLNEVATNSQGLQTWAWPQALQRHLLTPEYLTLERENVAGFNLSCQDSFVVPLRIVLPKTPGR